MKVSKRNLLCWTGCAVLLFGVTNLISGWLQSTTFNQAPMIRSFLFVAALYFWGLVRIFAHKKFAMPFMNFILIVYSIGFISNIAVSWHALTVVTGLLVIFLNIAGVTSNWLLYTKIKRDWAYQSST